MVKVANRGLEWWRGYYHFVKPYLSLQESLGEVRLRGRDSPAPRYQKRTPAMAAGLTARRWTVLELLSCPVPALSHCA
jgi:hypothetical protein